MPSPRNAIDELECQRPPRRGEKRLPTRSIGPVILRSSEVSLYLLKNPMNAHKMLQQNTNILPGVFFESCYIVWKYFSFGYCEAKT